MVARLRAWWLVPPFRRARVTWGLAALLVGFTVVEKPSSGVQLELLGRDTTLLFPVLRDPEETLDLWEQLGEEGPRRIALLQAYLETHATNGGAGE